LTDCPFLEYGINGVLFAMLDVECDDVLRKGVKDTLTSILTAATLDKVELQTVISLCKSILTCGKEVPFFFHFPTNAYGHDEVLLY
jgi:hypothetical protein